MQSALTEYGHYEQMRFIFEMNIITNNLILGLLGNERDAKPLDCKRFNLSFTGHYRIPGANMASGFLSVGYYGSDPYNVYYQRSLYFLRFGLGIGFFHINIENLNNQSI